MEIVKLQTDCAKESTQVERTRIKLLNELSEFSKHLRAHPKAIEPTYTISEAAPLSPTVEKIRKVLLEKHFPHK